jgi:xanthine dehydrogenase small subunit
MRSATRVALHFNAQHPVRMADNVRFTLNDQQVEITGISPVTTLLDWLRDHRGLRGTKEGCAEGDCGACTVVRAARGRLPTTRSIPASCCCRSSTASSVRTVEGLARRRRGACMSVQHRAGRGRRHAMRLLHARLRHVDALRHASRRRARRDRRAIHEALAGNLCRCTGYRPIVEAMTRIAGLAPNRRPYRSRISPAN